MPIMLVQIPPTSVGEKVVLGIDCTPWLTGSEVLVNPPEVTQVGANDLTIDTKLVPSIPTTIPIIDTTGKITNVVVAANKAIVFRVQGMQAGTYTLRAACETNGNPSQKVVRHLRFSCE